MKYIKHTKQIKQTFLILLTIFLLIITTEITNAASARYDVNQDGHVDSTDALIVLRHALNFNVNESNWKTSSFTGDVNCSGITNILDAQLLLNSSFGFNLIDKTNLCGAEEEEQEQEEEEEENTNDNAIIISSDNSGDYTCDGVQDQIQINKALSEVANNPDLTTVYLKGPMNCIIEEPIIISSNTKLLGDSNVKVSLKDYTEWPVNKPLITQKGGENWDKELEIQIYGDSNDSIENVEIAGFELTAGNQNALHGSWYYILMIFFSAKNLEVHDMNMHDSYGDIVRIMSTGEFNRTNNIKFYNNYLEGSGHDGLNFGYVNNLDVYNNEIYSTRTNVGIDVGECTNVNIHDNTIGNSLTARASGYAGIYVKNEEIKTTSAEIYNNYIFGKTAGIVIESDVAKDFQENVHIHHNRLYKITQFPGRDDLHGAIRIRGGHNTLIENNSIDGSEIDGILFEIGGNTEIGYKNTIRNNIISNVTNGYAINNQNIDSHSFISEYNDLYNNTNDYNNTTSKTDIHVNPQFVNNTSTNPANVDLHLKSANGRWNGATWVNDTTTSQCINNGNPTSDYSNEPLPNGNRVNIGAYGNTAEASK